MDPTMKFYSGTAIASISSDVCARPVAAAACLAPPTDLGSCQSLNLGHQHRTYPEACDDVRDSCCGVQSGDLRSPVAVDSVCLTDDPPANLNARVAYCIMKAWAMFSDRIIEASRMTTD